MTKAMRRACTEVDEILKYLPQEYVNKIPQKFRRMFFDARLDDYPVKINPNKSIKEQNVVYETLVILTILKMNYWCNSEEEKNGINQKLKENEKRVQDKYDITKLISKEYTDSAERLNENKALLDNKQKMEEINSLVKVEKQSWFSKLWRKIKYIFKKK